MVGQSISHYEILEKLGEGGMGVVYRARDTKLGRDVALKFLPAHLAASAESRERFMREARAAASLNHPNVCSIIDIAECDTPGGGRQLFIVMELVEGKTVRTLATSQLSGGEAVDPARWTEIAIQSAEGLAAAHAKGILHRDVKSDNLMVTTDGRIKIMDFGLAKMADAAGLTRAESTIGTLAYTAPEQLRGEEVTAASDVFSLGVVLYEVLTGRLPFYAGHDAATMYRILNEGPDPIDKYRPGVPARIREILDRALRKDPAERYPSMTSLLADLKEAAVPAAAPSGPAPPAGGESIAVLPFEDMSPQRDQDYFCEGLAEEIINSLTRLKNLRVSARTSAFAFRGKQMDVREIGRKLNVRHVLEGSVRKAGSRLRVTAQLITVGDGYHAWSERYDRELADVFEVQDDITSNIVQALQVVLTPVEQVALAQEKRVDVRAYECYLKGRQAMHQQTRTSHAGAIRMYQEATAIEPGYALAYAGMADCHSFLFSYWESTPEHREFAENASRRALELDPGLAEAHVSSGLAATLSKRWAEAEREFETALRLNPQLFEARYFFARTTFLQGKFREAVVHYEAAAAINPDDYQALFLATSSYRSLGQLDKMKEAAREGLRRAERHLELNPRDVRALYLGAGALEMQGDVEKGLEWATRALALEPEDAGTYYNIACFYAIVGDPEKAIECLEKALHHGFAQKEWLVNDSDLDPLRANPRFQSLLNSMKQ